MPQGEWTPPSGWYPSTLTKETRSQTNISLHCSSFHVPICLEKSWGPSRSSFVPCAGAFEITSRSSVFPLQDASKFHEWMKMRVAVLFDSCYGQKYGVSNSCYRLDWDLWALGWPHGSSMETYYIFHLFKLESMATEAAHWQKRGAWSYQSLLSPN